MLLLGLVGVECHLMQTQHELEAAGLWPVTQRGVETFDQRAARMVGGMCVFFTWPCRLPRIVTHLILHISHCARRV